MTKTTMLVAVVTVVASSTLASAQVYVQPANYGYASNNYVASQPVYAPAGYASPAYAPAAYTPVNTYYAGNACGQPSNYTCCRPCACSPCATSYAPQAVYSPVTYAPAPVACGPQSYIRRGSLGQPTLYVPGQPVRNFFRFFTP